MMSELANDITTDLVKELLTEDGYEVITASDDDVFHVKDTESGLTITCALQDNILFNTLPCFTLDSNRVTLELTRMLLDAENGISTSAFQIFELPNGHFSVALTNFCKLQDLGHEDRDDILSCITFLLVDVVAARSLLADWI